MTTWDTLWSILEDDDVRRKGISESNLGTARDTDDPIGAIELVESEGSRCFDLWYCRFDKSGVPERFSKYEIHLNQFA